MRVSDEPQGEPLEATTPPATAGEWRGYHGDDCPRRWKGTFNSTADECTCGLDEAHNAASRLRIAEDLVELAYWFRNEVSGDHTVFYISAAVSEFVDRYDALKGSSHE